MKLFPQKKKREREVSTSQRVDQLLDEHDAIWNEFVEKGQVTAKKNGNGGNGKIVCAIPEMKTS